MTQPISQLPFKGLLVSLFYTLHWWRDFINEKWAKVSKLAVAQPLWSGFGVHTHSPWDTKGGVSFISRTRDDSTASNCQSSFQQQYFNAFPVIHKKSADCWWDHVANLNVCCSMAAWSRAQLVSSFSKAVFLWAQMLLRALFTPALTYQLSSVCIPPVRAHLKSEYIHYSVFSYSIPSSLNTLQIFDSEKCAGKKTVKNLNV